MKTVEKMIEELKKFPMDAECYGYEGEQSGLGITKNGLNGFIFCGETNQNDNDLPSEYFSENQKKR